LFTNISILLFKNCYLIFYCISSANISNFLSMGRRCELSEFESTTDQSLMQLSLLRLTIAIVLILLLSQSFGLPFHD
jgi:hypothetical protein